MAITSSAAWIETMRSHFARAWTSVLRNLTLLRQWTRWLRLRTRSAIEHAWAFMPNLGKWPALSLARTTQVLRERSLPTFVRSERVLPTWPLPGAVSPHKAEAHGSLRKPNLDAKLLKEMERLSENVDELDDRTLMRLRLTTVAILCRIRDEVQRRSSLDLSPEHPE